MYYFYNTKNNFITNSEDPTILVIATFLRNEGLAVAGQRIYTNEVFSLEYSISVLD